MDAIDSRVRLLQVIIFALIMGVVACGLIFALLVDWNQVDASIGVLAILGVVSGLFMAVGAIWLPRLPGLSSRMQVEGQLNSNQDSSEQLDAAMQQCQSVFIVRFALLEGAAFLNLMVFLIEQSLLSLAVIAVLLGIMLVLFPRSGQIYQWLDESLDANQ